MVWRGAALAHPLQMPSSWRWSRTPPSCNAKSRRKMTRRDAALHPPSHSRHRSSGCLLSSGPGSSPPCSCRNSVSPVAHHPATTQPPPPQSKLPCRLRPSLIRQRHRCRRHLRCCRRCQAVCGLSHAGRAHGTCRRLGRPTSTATANVRRGSTHAAAAAGNAGLRRYPRTHGGSTVMRAAAPPAAPQFSLPEKQTPKVRALPAGSCSSVCGAGVDAAQVGELEQDPGGKAEGHSVAGCAASITWHVVMPAQS